MTFERNTARGNLERTDISKPPPFPIMMIYYTQARVKLARSRGSPPFRIKLL